MSLPFPTVTDYTDKVNYASYFTTDISSLMKKGPSQEKFFGSQQDDYIELSIFDSDDNLNIWKPIVQPPVYQTRNIEYQDIQNNTIKVSYDEFIPSFVLYDNTKILLDPKSDLENLGVTNGSYKLIYSFQSNIIGSYDKQCLLVKQISPSRREIKAILLLDKENFTEADKREFQSEFDCFVESKIEARDILPDFEYYLKQTYLLNFVNLADDTIKSAFSRAYAINGSDGLLKILNEIYNGYQLIATNANGVQQNQNFIGIVQYVMLMLYENYNNCFTYDQYSKILENIVNETISLKLKSIHDLNNTDTEICKTYLYNIFNGQIQSYLTSVNNDYKSKYVGPLKNSINFGDNQFVKILSTKKFSDGSLVIKLQSPLPTTFGINSTFWLTNTALNPVVQNVVLVNLPKYDTFEIKPPNFNLKVNDKRTSTTITLNDASDMDDASNTELILKQRFSSINVDYSKFENFVVYSSAKTRITIYKNKLKQIEIKQSSISQIESLTYSDAYTVAKLKSLSDEIDTIKLSFDGFEYYMWTNQYYNSFDRFPKSYEDEAAEYDTNNRDSLINNLPEYLLVDTRNDDFIIFLSMIGHHFDNIYIYIDKFPMLSYNAGGLENSIPNRVLDGMLSSFGWSMQSLVNDTSLSANYIKGANTSSISDKANTINNRILNTLPAILKSKGTIESVKLLLSCYGVPDNLLSVREFGSYSDVSQSLYTFDKLEYLLSYNPTSYVELPYDSSINTIEFKVAFSNLYSKNYNLNDEVDLLKKYSNNTTLDYRVYAYKTSLNNNGRIVFQLNDQKIESRTLPIFDGGVYSVMIRKNNPSSLYSSSANTDLIPAQYDVVVDVTEEGQTRLYSKTSRTLDYAYNASFSNDTSSSLKLGSGNFSGSIDKINLWTVPITDNNFIEHSNNFESYYQDDYENIRSELFFRLSYSYPRALNTSHEVFTYDSKTADLYNIPTVVTDADTTTDSVSSNPDLYQATLDARKSYGGQYDTSSLYPYSNVCVGDTPSTFPYNFIEYNVNQAYRLSNFGPNLLWNNKISVKDRPDVTAITPFQKSTPLDKNIDSNLIGIFASPTSNKNTEILKFFGDRNVIDDLGDPRLEFSQSYSPLDQYRTVYYSSGTPAYSGRVLYQEFITVYKLYFDSSIFESIRNVVAARNKLLTGILVEQTILERTKFPTKPVNAEVILVEVDYGNVAENQSAENIIVWSNDNIQDFDTEGTFGAISEKPAVQANPTFVTNILNNNFGGSYISDISTEQELYLCGIPDGSGKYITYLDLNISGSNVYLRSVPHYIWSVSYSASIESYDVDEKVHSYYKTFERIVATPSSSLYTDPNIVGTPHSGCTKNYLGHRPNVFSSNTYKVWANDGLSYGFFNRNSQTSTYTVDKCGETDQTSPIQSTIVTNTSVVTNNSGVLTVN
jgi:hypothetical protein